MNCLNGWVNPPEEDKAQHTSYSTPTCEKRQPPQKKTPKKTTLTTKQKHEKQCVRPCQYWVTE